MTLSVQRVRTPRIPFSLNPTTTAATAATICRMTVVDGGKSDDTCRSASPINEGGVQRCGKDHREDRVLGVVESHPGGERCGDNRGNCGPAVDKCEESRYGNKEGYGAAEEFACTDDPRGTDRITSTLREFFD